MTPRTPDDRPSDLPPAEAARARRRDRDAAAAERAGMRTGLAKQFKQVLDAQAKRGRAAGELGEVEDEEEPPPKQRDHKARRQSPP